MSQTQDHAYGDAPIFDQLYQDAHYQPSQQEQNVRIARDVLRQLKEFFAQVPVMFIVAVGMLAKLDYRALSNSVYDLRKLSTHEKIAWLAYPCVLIVGVFVTLKYTVWRAIANSLYDGKMKSCLLEQHYGSSLHGPTRFTSPDAHDCTRAVNHEMLMPKAFVFVASSLVIFALLVMLYRAFCNKFAIWDEPTQQPLTSNETSTVNHRQAFNLAAGQLTLGLLATAMLVMAYPALACVWYGGLHFLEGVLMDLRSAFGGYSVY